MAPSGRCQAHAWGVLSGLAGESTVLHLGTLVVFLITAMELWVAADSRVVVIGTQPAGAATRCKIHQFGSVFYAEAGLLKDTAGQFNAAAVAAQVATEQAAVLEAANAFEAHVRTPLVDTVRTLRTINPRYYHTHVREQAALQVAFFGMTDRGPQVAIRRFFTHEERHGRLSAVIDRFDCPGDCSGAITWAFLGGSVVLNRFLAAHPDYLTAHGPRATLQHLIALEAAAHPDLVSPPVDMLRLSPSGPVWVQRKPTCRPRAS
jgi:hypothetical protein